MNAEKDNWYRTGAVAKMLDTSPHTIRELARAGLIESQVRKGYRYISAREVERLTAEGLPPMPASSDVIDDNSGPDEIESARPARARGTAPGLYGEPSEQLIRSKGNLLEAEHNEQLRAMQRARKEEEARARRAQQVEQWRDGYRRLAAAAAHGEVLADLLSKVDRLLDTAPAFADVTAQVRQLIDAEMRPIREREQRDRALAEYRQRIERVAQSITSSSLGNSNVDREDVAEARELARSALAGLPPQASDRQMAATLAQAIGPVTERIARRRAQQQRTSDITRHLSTLPWLPHSPAGARDRLAREVRASLEALPLRATAADLDAAVERVGAPFRLAEQQSEAAYNQRRDAAAAANDADLRWILLLSNEVYTRLGQLEQRGRVAFPQFWDRTDLRRKLEQKIKPMIIAEILKNPSLSDAQLKQRIAALVDRHYEEYCDE